MKNIASCAGHVTCSNLSCNVLLFWQLATRHFIALQVEKKWGVIQAIVFATCNTMFVALQVAGKIATCNMAFREGSFQMDNIIIIIALLFICIILVECY